MMATWVNLVGVVGWSGNLTFPSAITTLVALMSLVAAVCTWFAHATVHSVIEEPAHLLYVTESLRRDVAAWEKLRAKFDPKIELRGTLLIAILWAAVLSGSPWIESWLVILCFVGITFAF